MAGGLGFDGGQSIVLPPLDLAILASTLRQNGHEVSILDCGPMELNVLQAYRRVIEFGPGAIITEVSLPSLYEDSSFINGLRSLGKHQVIVKTGIAHIPALEEVLKRSKADLCIYGEVDLSVHKILEGSAREGTAWIEYGHVDKQDAPPIQNLDLLPLPARDLLAGNRYYYDLLGEGVTTIQTSRGCPYPCGYYCPYPLVQGKKWRARSARHVLNEIREVVKMGIRKVLFRDATFTLDRKRVLEICRQIAEEGWSLDWWCETRVDCVDRELLKAMKGAGCNGISVGVETGDPVLLEGLAKKGVSIPQLVDLRGWARELGVRVHFLLMVGLPGEKRESIYRTYEIVKTLDPDSLGVTIVTPYPGTPLYFEARDKGWISVEDWSKFGGHTPVISTDDLTPGEMVIGQRMIFQGLGRVKDDSWLGFFRQRLFERQFQKWVAGRTWIDQN